MIDADQFRGFNRRGLAVGALAAQFQIFNFKLEMLLGFLGGLRCSFNIFFPGQNNNWWFSNNSFMKWKREEDEEDEEEEEEKEEDMMIHPAMIL